MVQSSLKSSHLGSEGRYIKYSEAGILTEPSVFTAEAIVNVKDSTERRRELLELAANHAAPSLSITI